MNYISLLTVNIVKTANTVEGALSVCKVRACFSGFRLLSKLPTLAPLKEGLL
jgi:hypothetical protein